MSHFRKMLFALVATASFFGISGTAQAQTSNPFVCNTSFSPLVVRVEGLRELVGDIVITCTGGNSIGTPTAPVAGGNPVLPLDGVVAQPQIGGVNVPNPTVPAINISVTVSAGRITNRLFSNNLTDALLFIDEPTNPNTFQPSRSNQNPCTSFAPSGFVSTPGVCTGLSYFFEGGVATGAGIPLSTDPDVNPANDGVPLNVFQGQYGIGGGFVPNERTITFVGVPVVQPGVFTGAGSRIFRIKNIRIQVANVFQVNNQVLAFLSIQNPPANLVLNNAQGIVGFVQQGLSFDALGGGPYAQCLGLNQVSSGSTLTATGALRFTEAYGVSFKRRGFGGPLDINDLVYNQFFTNDVGQANPTVNYNTESGFYNRTFPETNSLREVGLASNGTRLRARFSGIPAGVTVYVSLAPVTGVSFGSTALGQGTNAPGSAYAVSGTDSNGATAPTFAPVSSSSSNFTGTGSTQGSLAPGFTVTGAAYTAPSGMSTSVRYGQVTIGSDGTGTYVWEVLRSDDNAIDRFDFLMAIRFAPTTTIVTDITAVDGFVSGNYAPIVSPDPATLNNSTIPSFVLSPEDRKRAFTIGNCATNLLYPFVSSVTGFNTGMAISNTSKDPFSTPNESGVCLINFYGDAAGGAVDPPQQKTSRAIPAGKVATFNLLFGNADWGITPVAGFQGYIIVQCNFRWAHGFAFISDPSNLQTAHGYLALILDPNGLGGAQLRRATGAPNAEQLDN
ncbi:MAG: hypothetical protein NW208_10455 [Bryobacter sp.]|nr:hypothetical protein [Bryobacter sp.]